MVTATIFCKKGRRREAGRGRRKGRGGGARRVLVHFPTTHSFLNRFSGNY